VNFWLGVRIRAFVNEERCSSRGEKRFFFNVFSSSVLAILLIFDFVFYTLTFFAVSPRTGNPSPTVRWYRDGALIDDTFELDRESIGSPRSTSTQPSLLSIVVNTLTLKQLKRDDLHANLNCIAVNSQFAKPLEVNVSLEMSCKFFFFMHTLLHLI